MTIEKRPNHKPSNKINRSMLKNLSFIALLGIAVVGVPSELALVSLGDCTPGLAPFDFNSDNSKWNFRQQ